jgi:hypothetical protein
MSIDALREYGLQLYSVDLDPNETNDLRKTDPKSAVHLQGLMDEFREQLPPRLPTPKPIKGWQSLLERREKETPELDEGRYSGAYENLRSRPAIL